MTSISLTGLRLSRRAVYIPIAVLMLALVPLLYDLPLVGLGIEDLNMVGYLDEGDLQMYTFHGQYQRGPLHAPLFDNMNIYPKAFYNLVGVFLYPYTAISGGDLQLVMKTWRVFNMLAAMGAVIVLFLLARRVFRSDAVALLGAFVFAITPGFLAWTSGVRPNPMELLLIFATLYFGVRLFEGFSYRTFLIAAVLAALAFSSKYGGWLFVGLLPALAVYVLWRSQHVRDRWADAVKGQIRLFRTAIPFLVTGVMVLGGGLGWLLFTHSWDTTALILDISDSAFPPDKLARAPEYLETWRWLTEVVAFGALAASVIAIGVLVAVWRFSSRWGSTGSVRPSVPLYVFLAAWLVVQVILIYGLVYFATGPVYLARPDHFVSQFGFMIYYTALGGSYGPLREAPGFVESFQDFVNLFHPVWIGFAALIAYAGFREFFGRGRTDQGREQRLFLWLFAAISVAVVIGTRQAQIRHVLPALAILSLLIACATIPHLKAITQPNTWRTAWAGAAPVLVMVALLVGFHIKVAIGDWDFKRSKPSDTGFQVGEWLQQRYPTDTWVMTDWWMFYLPPAFANTSSVTAVDRAERRPERKRQAVLDTVVTFDPEVIVIAHPDGFEEFVNVLPLLTSDPVLNGRNYGLVQRFEYNSSERERTHYTYVLVYEKGAAAGTYGRGPTNWQVEDDYVGVMGILGSQ